MSSTYHRNPMPPLMQHSDNFALSEAVQIAVLQERSLANAAAIQNIFTIHAKAEDACNARFSSQHVRELSMETRVNDTSYHVKTLYVMIGDLKARQATAEASVKEFRDHLGSLWPRVDRLEGRVATVTNFVSAHGLKVLIGLAMFLTLLPSGSVKTAFVTMLGR